MIVAGILAIVAWGALSFGAVYPWASVPLLTACALVGLIGLQKKKYSLRRSAVLVSLAIALTATALQLIPLPVPVLRVLSPGTDTFLREYDLAYALGGSSHPLSIDPAATFRGLVMMAAFVLFLAGLLRGLSQVPDPESRVPSRDPLRRLATGIVAFGVVLALIGIIQKLLLGDHAWGGMKIYGFWSPTYELTTPFGPFVNRNHFAGWMLMGLPLAVGLALGAAEGPIRMERGWQSTLGWLSSRGGGRFQLMMFATSIMAISLLMTKSRSGLAGLAVALAIFSVLAARHFRSRLGRRVMPLSLLAMFVLVFAFAGGDVAARIVAESDAVDLRKGIWTDSVRVVRGFPLTGTGLNTFGTAMIRYQTSERDKHFREAHNDYLQLAVEGGLLLGIPVLLSLVAAARTIHRRFAERHIDRGAYWLRVGATTGLVAIGAQSLVEFSLQMPGNAALFVVLLAIAMHPLPTGCAEGTAEQPT